MFFFFKPKTAYEIYQCDWSSDVCSSDLMTSHKKIIKPFTKATRLATSRKSSLHRPTRTKEKIGRASCRERV